MNETTLKSIRHVALDMDGTIYKGGTLFEFTHGFLALLTRLGIGYTFLTNNCSRSVSDYLSKLEGFGIQAAPDQIFTSALATIDYLNEEMPGVRSLYVLGTASLSRELEEHGFRIVEGHSEPDAVIAAFDPDLPYSRLCKGAWWIREGKPFIATHPDRVCPTDEPTLLVDCGSVCACLTAATGVAPVQVLGKPHRRMLTGIVARHGLQRDQLAMAGDRLYTDVEMARQAGALGVLVLTGETTAAEAALSNAPDIVVPSLRELGGMLLAAHEASSG